MNYSSTRQESPLHHSFSGRDFSLGLNAGNQIDPRFVAGRDYALDEIDQVMPTLGFGVTAGAMKAMMAGEMIDYAMDAIQQPVTTPSITNLVQFYQNWLPGIIEVQTAARKIDEIVGMNVSGAWSDEQIVQQIVENSGAAVPYGDATAVPFADWNQNFVYRTVVRFEQGMRVGILEEDRSARSRVNSGAQKRKSAGLQLEIARNQIGFYGYNAGANLTYGLLNDPGLPAYVGVSGGTWASATFLVIQAQILTALAALRTQTQEVVDPHTTPITMTVAMAAVDYLAKTSDFGVSVWAWLKQYYPNVRVVSCPQYNAANAGSNVFTLHADTVADSGTDDTKTFVQVVPAKFQLLGIQKTAKYYEEDYSNATAGVFCKRPYAVYRASGI